jgi:hypothetical protein
MPLVLIFFCFLFSFLSSKIYLIYLLTCLIIYVVFVDSYKSHV